MARTGSKKADPKHVPREEWETPWRIVEALSRFTGPYTLDVCAQKPNAKARRWFNRSKNGLKQDWNTENAWCNPPYGKGSSDWVEKAIDECRKDHCRTATVLLPANITDRIMFHEQILVFASDIVFFRGRIAFEYKGVAYPESDISNMAVLFRGEFVRYAETDSPPYEPDLHSVSARVGR